MAIVSANGAATPLSPNNIINGAFDFWQRGTSFTVNNNYLFTADRWQLLSTNTGGSVVASQQAFTPGSSPAPNYEGNYFLRNTASSPTGATYNVWQHKIEDVRTLSNQTVTLSFYAKADSTRTLLSQFFQNFGAGGSNEIYTGTSYSYTLGTTWQRFTTTLVLPSVSGKTLGAGNNLRLEFVMPINTSCTIDIWGVQLESGSVATPFRRNSPNIQAELAACQRYFQRYISQMPGRPHQIDVANRPEWCLTYAQKRTNPVISVTTPTGIIWTNYTSSAGIATTTYAGTLTGTQPNEGLMFFNVASGITAYTGPWGPEFSTNVFIDIDAEL